MFFPPTRAAFVGLLLILSTTAAPLQKQNPEPVITTNFADPSVLKVGDTWYAFGSQSNVGSKHIKVQLATSKDLKTWTVTGKDALGTLAPWADASNPKVWAPSVSQRDDGSFLMYYSAITKTAGNGLLHCLGTAMSKSIQGPYNSNSDEPFACPTEQGGALDASAFHDADDGKHYALYKIDANALGHGGLCENTVPPIQTTPIVIQQVQADGTTKIGDPKTLLTNSESDGPLVEAPYLVRNADGVYVLFFSSHCWATAQYAVNYATSTAPTGGFVRSAKALWATGTRGMIGPGGASILPDGKYIAFHGYASREEVGSVRSMYIAPIQFRGREVLI
ncbi:glycoside hydrolase family 43 [Lecanosticta acicola]|uniref:Glycoside hydrolase family 43 n=1 Tax=Lecanosticta acicola TaxID=111012 RepID=A0AAI9ECI6_9PEZI|nr:glycoside hydrolase family 43 [Lecanosticta acicola]